MKITLLHPHLKPGGVTTVILQQINALIKDCEILTITGGDAPMDFPAPHARVKGLSYSDPDLPEKSPNPYETAEAVASAIYDRWPKGCDVVHVHNPLLAKNKQLLTILDLLKKKGFKLFLQVHDFSEDGRPGSYYENQQYPADCHYGTINSRDYRILENSGLNPNGIHKLFNMVNPIDTSGVQDDATVSVVYPVRAIPRKNIGEAILLSLFFPADTPLAITMPPNSLRDWIAYNEWRYYVKKNNLHVLFEASLIHDFRALVANASYLITTSIAEGFGFTYLEAWTAGKAIMGRKLPDICTDFEQQGINLDHLYESLFVPIKWIDRDAFEKKWKECVRDTYSRYGAPINESFITEGFKRLTHNNRIDFSILDEQFQRVVIDRLIDNDAACAVLEKLNPALSGFRTVPAFNQVIRSNRDVVLGKYNVNAYRRRLLDIYKKVQSVPVRHSINRFELLGQFLHLENFSLIKWCDDDLS